MPTILFIIQKTLQIQSSSSEHVFCHLVIITAKFLYALFGGSTKHIPASLSAELFGNSAIWGFYVYM